MLLLGLEISYLRRRERSDGQGVNCCCSEGRAREDGESGLGEHRDGETNLVCIMNSVQRRNDLKGKRILRDDDEESKSLCSGSDKGGLLGSCTVRSSATIADPQREFSIHGGTVYELQPLRRAGHPLAGDCAES